MFSKPEVNHKKVKIDVSALDIAFKLDYWVQITPLIDFAPKKILKPHQEVHKKTLKNTYIS